MKKRILTIIALFSALSVLYGQDADEIIASYFENTGSIENWKNKIVFITEYELAENVVKKLADNSYRWISHNCSIDELETLLEEQFETEQAIVK